jgi:hypothetical protein
MNAEEVGRKLSPTSSGRAGLGPRYQFAKQQREVHLAQRADRERDQRELAARREELRAAQARIATDAAARRNHDSGTEDLRSVAEFKVPQPEPPAAPQRRKPNLRPPAKPTARTGMEDIRSAAGFKFPEPKPTEPLPTSLTFTLLDDIPEKP